jgi:hypothetical protein
MVLHSCSSLIILVILFYLDKMKFDQYIKVYLNMYQKTRAIMFSFR